MKKKAISLILLIVVQSMFLGCNLKKVDKTVESKENPEIVRNNTAESIKNSDDDSLAQFNYYYDKNDEMDKATDVFAYYALAHKDAKYEDFRDMVDIYSGDHSAGVFGNEYRVGRGTHEVDVSGIMKEFHSKVSEAAQAYFNGSSIESLAASVEEATTYNGIFRVPAQLKYVTQSNVGLKIGDQIIEYRSSGIRESKWQNSKSTFDFNRMRNINTNGKKKTFPIDKNKFIDSICNINYSIEDWEGQLTDLLKKAYATNDVEVIIIDHVVIAYINKDIYTGELPVVSNMVYYDILKNVDDYFKNPEGRKIELEKFCSEIGTNGTCIPAAPKIAYLKKATDKEVIITVESYEYKFQKGNYNKRGL